MYFLWMCHNTYIMLLSHSSVHRVLLFAKKYQFSVKKCLNCLDKIISEKGTLIWMWILVGMDNEVKCIFVF